MCMDKGDPTYIQKKTSTKYREEPPKTRSSKQAKRFEEGSVVESDTESLTLIQQNQLAERFSSVSRSEKVIKRERMETEGQALNRLLELMISKQAESESRNRDLIERLSRDIPAASHGVDRIDLTRESSYTYPKMTEKDNMAKYLAKLEYSFTINDTPEARKCSVLWSHLTTSACDKLMATGPVPGESYASLREKLLSEFKVGYATAANQALQQIDPDINMRDTLAKMDEMLAIVTETATTIPEAISCFSRMLVRSQLNESLVYELDVQVPDNHYTFHRKCQEWKDRQPTGTSFLKTQKKEVDKTSMNKMTERFKCFTCGKPGHTSKYCRMNKQTTAQPDIPDRKPIVCYNCREVGHKAPNCPKPKSDKPKKKEVKLLSDKKPSVKELQENEILVRVAGKEVPVTLDSGATITVLPKERVPETWLTGKQIVGKGFGIDHNLNIEEANLSIVIEGKLMKTLGGVVPSKEINGTGVLSYRSTANARDLSFPKLLENALNRSDEDRLYWDYTSTTPTRQGAVGEGVQESEGRVEKEEEQAQQSLGIVDEGSLVESEGIRGEESDNNGEQVEEDKEEMEKQVECDSVGEDNQDEGTEAHDTSADETITESCISEEKRSETSCVNSTSDEETEPLVIAIPRYTENNNKLREDTASDESLKTMRNLADKNLQGYSWKAGLVTRERLDDLGRVKTQICVPTDHRARLMTLAHENFGHMSRNSVVKHISKSFYWPTLWRDVRIHVQSCDTCQRVSKVNPKKAPMVRREVVTVPFERVSIDLVGPLPKSRGGYKYLFTYIDNASRWPEAIPLRSITSKSVISAFETICLRNGFPRTVISDNGTQFGSHDFKRFCSKHHIQAIQTSPYRPQSNGLVERMHGTLVTMINKLSKTKQGFWHEITKLALYFVRMTPSSATGFSPYMTVHGWEPASPLEIVKEGLLENTLEDVDITTWVQENMERVESIADSIVQKQTDVIEHRKVKRDKYSKERVFEHGTQVLYRTPGMMAKLTDAWEGPYVVDKRLGPVTYSLIIQGVKKRRIVHVNTIKEYKETAVRKITTVLEEDNDEDEITSTNDKLKLVACDKDTQRQADIQMLRQEFSETLNEEPGTTELTTFRINTGNATPISQRPYMTANSLKKGVEEEIEWMLERGFIEESSAEWSSPIVTVKKPNGKIRVCVDYRKLNSVTTPIPFYMPRIEEVLEATGQATVISKMDLSKGYYQVKVCPEDRDKTTFVCHKGKYRFNRMPFGVCNAPAIFQTLMEKILHGLGEFCKVYMDDLIIFSDTWEEHLTHVRKVLTALKAAGLTANPAKCEWGGKQLQFLGHIIGSGEMSIPKARIQALKSYVKPTTKRGLRSFLGAISFYRKFAKDLAKYTAHLSPCTSKSAPSKVIWTESMDDAFHAIRELMCHNTKLVVPLPSDSFSIVSDASGLGLGGVLQVYRDGEWTAAAYYSRQTRGAETRYTATELEALALLETVSNFSYYLYGHEFKAFTDHHALLSLKHSERLNGRLKRLALKLQPWRVNIEYLPGKENQLADALSRQEWRHNELERISSGAGGLDDNEGAGGSRDSPSKTHLHEGEEADHHLLGAGGCGGPTSTKDESERETLQEGSTRTNCVHAQEH